MTGKRSTLLGARIRMLRNRKGMTLEKLAGRCGLVKGYLSGLENAKVGPGTDRTARVLAKALGVPACDLMILAYLDRAAVEVTDLPVFHSFYTAVIDRDRSLAQ